MKILSDIQCRFVLLIIVSWWATWQVSAQQDPQYTQYMFNGLSINPAYAGTRGGLSLTAVGRYQWVDIKGAPRTISLSAHSPLAKKVALGLNVEGDEIGVHRRIGAFASYAYHLPLGSEWKLSLGLQAGVHHYSSRFTEIAVSDPDPNFSEDFTKTLPNFGAGFFLYSQRFYFGAAAPHLLQHKLRTDTTDADISKVSHQYRHYLLTGGAVFHLADGFDLKPSFLIKSVPASAPFVADLNLSLLVKETVWVGVSYRSFDSIDFIAELLLGKMRLGYSYDLTLTKLSNYNSGSHEVMLGYDFGGDSKGGKGLGRKERVVTPRYF